MVTSESHGEKIGKSINIWQNYRQEHGVLFFWLTGLTLLLFCLMKIMKTGQ